MFGKIGLIMNRDKPEAVRMAMVAKDFFAGHGIGTLWIEQDACLSDIPDLILTFGGDGTFLSGARFAMEHDIPVMGINLGTVGFLTEEEPDHLSESLQAILNGSYQIEKRFLLKVELPESGKVFYALNDAVVTRGGFARLIQVDCKVNGEQFGVIGEIHPKVRENYSIGKRVYCFSLNVDTMFEYAELEKHYTPLPKYPAITRDLAVICDKEIPVAELEKAIKNGAGKTLESVKLFDVYQGKQILPGKKSVAFSLTLRSAEGTLTDEHAASAVNKAVKALEKLGAVLRS